MIAQELTGQLIASIRRVTCRQPPHPPAEPRAAIELEVKSGRHAHLVAANDAEGIQLRAGPFCPDTSNTQSGRDCQDLTAWLPSAFDGRPSIAVLAPIDPLPSGQDAPVARAWRFELTTGVCLLCQRTGNAVEIRETNL